MEKRDLKKGDVVQLNEKCRNAWFLGCFMLVTEPKGFGAMGFIQVPGVLDGNGPVSVLEHGRHKPFYRANYEEMDYIGHTNLLPASHQEGENQ